LREFSSKKKRLNKYCLKVKNTSKYMEFSSAYAATILSQYSSILTPINENKKKESCPVENVLMTQEEVSFIPIMREGRKDAEINIILTSIMDL